MTTSKTIQLGRGTRTPSASKVGRVRHYVLLGGNQAWRKRLGREKKVTICSSAKSVLKAVMESSIDSIWISSKQERTEELLQATGAYLASNPGSRRRFGNLFMLESPRAQSLPSIHGWFGAVIGEVPSFTMLPMDQLIEVLSASDAKGREVFVGGIVDQATGTLALVRGNLERLTVPLSIFRPSGRLSPNFLSFELDDYGNTLRFGDYEATADVVLWEVDSDYRKKAKAIERAHAEGFGPSLRRLRTQRGLTQSDFPNVSRKTISRIEKGEIEKPHGMTLNRIAKALSIAPNEIETY